MLRIYNTLSKKKEPFTPLNDKRVNLFVCGPTVYDLAHIGHARTYIAFDIVARYLRYYGYVVTYVQNITDIDDKIIVRAAEKNIEPQKLARDMETHYREDVRMLDIESVNTYARATDHIGAIITQINTLLHRGFAYEADGSVYYDTKRFPNYGKLSGQNLEKLHEGVRIDPDPAKHHPYDFALWKAAKPGEPTWPSPWGPGRPGWHIEDTAITDSVFGPQYDIHGGGRDLIFPHHECEVAQQEGASGKSPMVRYWMHTGFLQVKKTKMSKSLGNFVTIRDALKLHSPQIIRMIVAQTHYRSPIDYNERVVKQANEFLQRMIGFVERIKLLGQSPVSGDGRDSTKKDRYRELLEKTKKEFFERMDDDFNTPRALATLANFMRNINPRIEKHELSKTDIDATVAFFKELDAIFGFRLLAKQQARVPAGVQKLVEKREGARKNKDWKTADVLRAKVEKLGFLIEDTPQGPRVKKPK